MWGILNRLRAAVYEWGQPGTIDQGYADEFTAHVNDEIYVNIAIDTRKG